jgi:hypothetical protein
MSIVKRTAGVATAAAIAAALGFAAPAVAYGSGSQHQIEISANLPSNVFGPGTGGGIWLWIQLGSAGSGTYQGADCLHHAALITPTHTTGAGHDSGTVTSTVVGTTVVITGVAIGTTPVTITVPNADGHYRLAVDSVFSGLGTPPGMANVQVAP